MGGYVLGVLAAGALAGCDSGPNLYEVSGRVMFQGKPVPVGTVLFEPDATKGHDSAAGFAHVKDGWYDTRQDGRGVIGGPYRVRVNGFSGKSEEYMPRGAPLFEEHALSVDVPSENSTLDIDVQALKRRR